MVLAGASVVFAMLVVARVVTEFLVEAPSRRAAMQAVAGAVLAVVACRVGAAVRADLARQPRSTFDAATEPRSLPPPERSRLHHLRDDIRASARSQAYFDSTFWPRLVKLAEARTGRPADWLVKPAPRSFGRGPSVDALTDVVGAIEARP